MNNFHIHNTKSVANQNGRLNLGIQAQKRTDRAHSAGKHFEAIGRELQTTVTGLTNRFKTLADFRHDIVVEAKEKLTNGYFGNRETAKRLAETILDF